jgi:hypothetical protein
LCVIHVARSFRIKTIYYNTNVLKVRECSQNNKVNFLSKIV